MNKGDNEHYLIFVNAADDAGAFPASRLQSITCKTDSALLLKFSGGLFSNTFLKKSFFNFILHNKSSVILINC